MLKRELVHRVYLLFAMLVIAICGCVAMLLNDSDTTGGGIVFLLTYVVLLPGIIPYLRTRTEQRPPSVIIWLNVLLLWMLMISLLIVKTNLHTLIFLCLNTLITQAALCVAYGYSARYGYSRSIIFGAFLMLLILSVQYGHIYQVANETTEAHLITAYYPMFLLPLVLTHPSKIIRYGAILLVTIIIFSSIKRGGLLALGAGLIVYILCSSHIRQRGMKAILFTLFGLGLVGTIFYAIASSEYGTVIERFTSIQSDEGSGRLEVWGTTWYMIQHSNSITYLLGHGVNAVFRDSPLYLSAHNDLLEAWYDYGVIGFILYVITLVSLFRYTRRLIRKKSPVAPSIAMLVTIMLILTMISHVLIYYFMTLCCLTIGLLVGADTYDEHHE